MVNTFGRKRTPEDKLLRKIEYRMIRDKGFNHEIARRVRDWRSNKIRIYLENSKK